MTGYRCAPDDEYMTLDEFAKLPSDVHHAVWAASARKAIDAVPSARSTGCSHRYRRDQVEAIIRELEAARG